MSLLERVCGSREAAEAARQEIEKLRRRDLVLWRAFSLRRSRQKTPDPGPQRPTRFSDVDRQQLVDLLAEDIAEIALHVLSEAQE